jgi:hypothetical protein
MIIALVEIGRTVARVPLRESATIFQLAHWTGRMLRITQCVSKLPMASNRQLMSPVAAHQGIPATFVRLSLARMVVALRTRIRLISVTTSGKRSALRARTTRWKSQWEVAILSQRMMNRTPQQQQPQPQSRRPQHRLQKLVALASQCVHLARLAQVEKMVHSLSEIVRSAGSAGIGMMMNSKMMTMTWMQSVMPCTKNMNGTMKKCAASPIISRIAGYVGAKANRCSFDETVWGLPSSCLRAVLSSA